MLARLMFRTVPRGAVEHVVLCGGHVADVLHVRRHRLVAPALAAEEECLVRCELGGAQKEFFDAGLAVGQAIPEKGEVACVPRVGRNGIVRFGVESVVRLDVVLHAVALKTLAADRAAAVS